MIDLHKVTMNYDAGEPFDVLRAGPHFILPWKIKHPTHEKRWTLYPHLWRGHNGQPVSFDTAEKWALKQGFYLRRETFNPNSTGQMTDPI